ncbi:hypothetical protein CKM354_001088000 [Cercospora kikuchii]|uniref:HPP transmembrane region domain-containing protein n=1 Tax=Cercospora kikuchii TaxID=84275 RepID=A0A9P3CUF4_9PEZI|nr:uncharacterized protein CKM354_001088000 [Cercospora kikuchii]GIZ47797.1 hypothetical protein CKM354_001088000 [Cercospora kikuchii]
MVQSEVAKQFLDFDIDIYINPYIPHNRLYILPDFASRWLGYRHEPQKEPWQALQWPITFLATVAGLCLVGGIGNHAPGILAWHPPVIIASLGASAVLDFNTIKSPLAQPRNSIIGNTLAAISGVAIAKLFQHNSNFDNIQWVSGAVGCALASWVMSLTNTIHPPGGATAVLASTQVEVIRMGWRYVPIVLLDSVLMVVVALLFNNIMRQYPIYWWSPGSVGSKLRKEKREEKHGKEEEEKDEEKGERQKTSSDSGSDDNTLRKELSDRVDFVDGLEEIQISPYRITLPRHVKLDDHEVMLLQNLQERIRMHGEINAP